MPSTDETVYLDAVEKIYATALNDESWSPALDCMAALFGAVGISFEIFENTTHRPISLELGSNLGEVSKQEYVDYYGQVSPRVLYNIGRPSGFISYDHMILSEAEMDRDEFYADCIAPIGLRYFLAAQVFSSASHQAVFAAQRSPQQGHVGAPEIETLRRLLPHLQQAVDLKFRLAAAQINMRQPLSGLEELNEGCLTIDRAGTVKFANSKAVEFAARRDGIGIGRNCLSFADRTATRHFDRILDTLHLDDDQIGQTREFPARRANGNRPYLVAVRPLPRENEFTPYAEPAAAMVFIRDPGEFPRLDAQLLKQSYAISDAEAELALSLDQGLTLREIADKRSVSINTVRSQLYALMSKLTVKRQTDLVRLLAQYRRPFA